MKNAELNVCNLHFCQSLLRNSSMSQKLRRTYTYAKRRSTTYIIRDVYATGHNVRMHTLPCLAYVYFLQWLVISGWWWLVLAETGGWYPLVLVITW